MQDRSYKADGDGGIDFTATFEVPNAEPRAFTVDVKTFRIPNHLICEQGSHCRHLRPSAVGVEDLDQIWFLGWEWGKKVLAAPVAVCTARGPPVHAIRSGLLRSMDELFGAWCVQRLDEDRTMIRATSRLAAQKAKEAEAPSTGQGSPVDPARCSRAGSAAAARPRKCAGRAPPRRVFLVFVLQAALAARITVVLPDLPDAPKCSNNFTIERKNRCGWRAAGRDGRTEPPAPSSHFQLSKNQI